jgi:hypothetical protein
MEIITTESGDYRIFQGRDAGSPQFFELELWYYEPNDPHGGDGVFSEGYPTAQDALDAAEAWEEEAMREDMELVRDV